MKRYISIGISIALVSGTILPYSITSFAKDVTFNYSSSSTGIDSLGIMAINNTHDSIIIGDEEEDDSLPSEFVPDRSITFNEALLEIETSLAGYKASGDIALLKECVLTFGEIPKISKSLTNNIVKNSVKLATLFDSIRFECYNLDTIEKQELYVKLFAEEIFLGWKYDKNIEYFKDEFLIKGLIDYNKNRLFNIQDRLDYLLFVIEFYNEMGDPYPEFNIIPNIDSPLNPPNGHPDTGLPPVFDNDDVNQGIDDNITVIGPIFGDNEDNNQDNESTEITEEQSNLTTYYKAINNKCYKVTELTKDGVTAEVDKVLVDKSEYAYCGIYDYVNFGDGYSSGHVVIDEDYIYSNQNETSDYFVYYTVTKNQDAPYYYNTGIRADDDNKSISFNQLKDSFYQLAIKNKSFTIDDNGKSLYIFNGKPVVLKQTIDDIYTQTDIDRLLSPFDSLGIKIMKNTEYEACQAKYEEAQANKEITYIDNLVINGVTIYEKHIAWIENDVIKVPIEVIAKLLSASTSLEDGHLNIIKNDSKIVLYSNKKDYIVNGENKTFLTEVTLKGDMYISELADIPKALGYNVEFDPNNNELTFTKM